MLIGDRHFRRAWKSLQ